MQIKRAKHKKNIIELMNIFLEFYYYKLSDYFIFSLMYQQNLRKYV